MGGRRGVAGKNNRRRESQIKNFEGMKLRGGESGGERGGRMET